MIKEPTLKQIIDLLKEAYRKHGYNYFRDEKYYSNEQGTFKINGLGEKEFCDPREVIFDLILKNQQEIDRELKKLSDLNKESMMLRAILRDTLKESTFSNKTSW